MTTSVSVDNLNRAHIYVLRGQLTEALALVEGLGELDVPKHVFQQATALRMFLLSMIDPGAGRENRDEAAGHARHAQDRLPLHRI
jgi:hypothetical protein